jgi:hypothetical protein
MLELPNDTVWIFTGNKMRFSADMARRVVPVSLDSNKVKSTFVRPSLDAWVEEHRCELVGAVLSILSLWIEKGLALTPCSFPTFDNWANTVNSILCTSGVRGLGVRVRTAGQQQGRVATSHREAFYEKWWGTHSGSAVTASELSRLCHCANLLPEVLRGPSDEASRSKRMGKFLTNILDETDGQWLVTLDGKSATNSNTYRLQRVSNESS